jgi:hypothetical protein
MRARQAAKAAESLKPLRRVIEKKRKEKKRTTCKGVDVANFIDALRELCESQDARNYPLGKRSAFYEIYNRGIIPNLDKSVFSSLYRHVNNACEDGRLDDDYFEDTSRRLSHNSGDDTVADALLGRLSVTELDHWKDQPVVPIIMCEKDGHQGVLSRITNPAQVHLFTSKGTWSRPSLRKVAKAVAVLVNRGKEVKIGYVGDHDPAGLFRIERTAREGNFVGQNNSVGLRQHLEEMGITTGWSWERIAITTEQFRNLPIRGEMELYTKDNVRLFTVEECEGLDLYTRNEDGETKEADSNTYEYVKEYGFERADAEALGFDGMRAEVHKFIEDNTDMVLWEESKENSRTEVERWQRYISTIDGRIQVPERENICESCGEELEEKEDAKGWGYVHTSTDEELCAGGGMSARPRVVEKPTEEDSEEGGDNGD